MAPRSVTPGILLAGAADRPEVTTHARPLYGAGRPRDLHLERDGIEPIRHCERSEAIQGVLVRLWIASPRSQ
ncbi:MULTISPECIES: hypothetical protein [unclassified Sphingomonas]|jgi:hypothetical protein|uniref:hypothetical protein n=1 Tax=unclassified Sphingomonas TaxID=196159 RepID=UPI0025F7EEE3|nr:MULTISPECIES: hypothetical protein [unclassified Sphingomonas]